MSGLFAAYRRRLKVISWRRLCHCTCGRALRSLLPKSKGLIGAKSCDGDEQAKVVLAIPFGAPDKAQKDASPSGPSIVTELASIASFLGVGAAECREKVIIRAQTGISGYGATRQHSD